MSQRLSAKPAGLLRILTAMIYDSFLIVGLMIAVVFAFTATNGFASTANQPWKQHLLTLLLLLVWGGFYTYFCSKQGQTLGMRAWKLLLVNQQNRPPNARHAFGRWLLIMLITFLPVSLYLTFVPFDLQKNGLLTVIILLLPPTLGYSFILLDKNHRSLFDYLTRSKVVFVAHNPYQKRKE